MATNMDRLKTVRTANGEFEVWWDGVKTEWWIINGSRGLSGRSTRNMYGFTKGFSEEAPRTWVGPLVSCKKLLALKLSKETK